MSKVDVCDKKYSHQVNGDCSDIILTNGVTCNNFVALQIVKDQAELSGEKYLTIANQCEVNKTPVIGASNSCQNSDILCKSPITNNVVHAQLSKMDKNGNQIMALWITLGSLVAIGVAYAIYKKMKQ